MARERIGRPLADGPDGAEVRKLRKLGRSWAEVAEQLGCTVAMARRRHE